jgi:hypothetical protein
VTVASQLPVDKSMPWTLPMAANFKRELPPSDYCYPDTRNEEIVALRDEVALLKKQLRAAKRGAAKPKKGKR